ncbi:cytochrome P450 [Xylaria sp. CBS 124048]|nr:cytochrome P450 [Xylaria sp. CBS 124048]
MTSALDVAQGGLGLIFAYLIGNAIYNVFFHPLRKYPGPLSHQLSAIPRSVHQIYGRLPFHIDQLHKKYGPVVRLAPDELVFSSAQAWNDIYGHRKAGAPELVKYEKFYRLYKHNPQSILNADKQAHSILRRRLANGFSERSLRDQEPIIGGYVNLLITRLKAAVNANSRQNIREWYNWTTFDLIGDLSFGEGGFGCLVQTENHPWIQLVSDTMSQGSMAQALCRLGFHSIISWANQIGLMNDRKHHTIVHEKLGKRMESGERPDFMEGLITHRTELGLTHKHLDMTAAVLVVAGSETTATLLAGVTYYLTTHPEILKRLQAEVRSSFQSDEEINLLSVGNLSYMLACLNEALRVHPPVASNLPRLVPHGGVTIDGHFVPENTIVSVCQYAVNRDKNLWTEPEKFAPERWLHDPKYKDDQLDSMQAFSVGPRACIGRNLAYAEMRLILAKVIYNFDFELAADSRNWSRDQKAFDLSWVSPPLHVNLKPIANQ